MALGDQIAVLRDGRLVQTGTPARIVIEPADAYVEAFVRDVPRARVLTAESVMAVPAGAVETQAETQVSIAPGTLLEDLLPALLEDARPLAVAGGDGRVVGVVTREAVVRALAGREG